MRLAPPRITLELVLGAALVASLAMNFRQARQIIAGRHEREADRQSLRALEETLHQRDLQQIPAQPANETPEASPQAALAKRDAALQRLDRELNEARSEIAQLQTQLQKSSDERDQELASAKESDKKAQDDLQRQLDELKQELDSAQAELQASRERVAALEQNNAKLRGDSSEASGRSADTARVVADLEDLNRRREAYLTSIIRRYRDLTSQFRAMGGMLDSGRDPNSSALSGAALTRIQNAVSATDDDLRQLSDLNARARDLEKKLEKK
jgi:chromosome segregation ATPase